MSANNDIESQILMEMEKEINQSHNFNSSNASVSPRLPFELTPTLTSPEIVAREVEEDRIQAEIEERLRRKKESREARRSASRSPKEGHLSLSGSLPARTQPQDSLPALADNRFHPSANPLPGFHSHHRDPLADSEKQAQQPVDARREAEEQAKRNAVEQLRLQVEAADRRQAAESAKGEAEALARQQADGTTEEGDESNHKSADVRPDNDGDSSSSNSSDDDNSSNSSGPAAELESGASRNSIGQPEAVRNDNGILSCPSHPLRPPHQEEADSPTYSREDRPLELFESQLEKELRARGVATDAVERTRIDVRRFDTIREPGKCLGPPAESSDLVPPHVRVQLGFFSAKQTIISLQSIRRRSTANRERVCTAGERPLSTLTGYFESEVLQNRALTVDDDEFPHNVLAERILAHEEILAGDGTAVEKAVSSISYGDPIQVWERVRGGAADEKETGRGANSGETAKGSTTTNNLWVSDVNIVKPIPAIRTFTGGFLLCVTAQAITSQVSQLHGEGADPLIVAVCLFSIADSKSTKVSETFYFDSGLDVFYPQKQRRELAKDNKVITFVPNEFRGTLYLVARVYRPCSEDFDNYVDLYSRADRYKPAHVAPMKQETLLICKSSDVLEELGWMAAPCQSGQELSPVISVSTIYRRSMTDTEMIKAVNDSRYRGVLRTVPLHLEFCLSDLSKYETAFPSEHAEPLPQENETMVSLLNPDVPGARAEVYRYAPCCIPILNSGYFTTYTNVYYFRVSHLKLLNVGSIRSFPSSHRTYTLQICVKDRDDTLSTDGAIQCIYGRGLNALALDTCAWTSTTHASHDNPLSDEFKIQLPLNLTNRHHLFFTLYATCQKNSVPNNQPSALKVAYAAFPLMVDDVVQTRDRIDIKFIAADQAAVVGAGGYLRHFDSAPPSALLNNGEPVLRAASQTKTTVHASNRIVAAVFSQCQESFELLRKDDGVLSTSGELHTLPTNAVMPHLKVINLMSQLPLAEILAFYPFLSSYAFSLIGSTSRDVSLPSRMHMLDVFIGLTVRAQHYDTNAYTIQRRHGTVNAETAFPRTSAGSILYHFLSNDTLYEGSECTHKTPLYAGLTETWYHLMTAAKAPEAAPDPAAREPSGPVAGETPSSQPAPAAKKESCAQPRHLLREVSEVSWFLFDAILRSVYVWAHDHPGTKRTELLDPTYYNVAGDLCVRLLEKLSTYDESTVVKRVALFVRGLMRYCDRGRVLMMCEKIVNYFESEGNGESMTNFIHFLLDDGDAAVLLLPSADEARPVFLSKILVSVFSAQLVHSNRETRCLASGVLYNFLCTLANDPKVPSGTLSGVASQLFALVLNVTSQWKAFLQMNEKTPAAVATNDKRQLAMILLWIVYYTPRPRVLAWLREEQDPKCMAGFMHMVADAQNLFRYTAGENKHLKPDLSTEELAEVKAWDARVTILVSAIGVQLTHFFSLSIPTVLRTVKDEKPSPCVFPFFVMLESVLHLGNSTATLQMGSALLHQVVCQYYPEIVSRKARMSSGIVLLTFRLMSSCCRFVRSSASATFLLMSQAWFSWKNTLSKVKSLTANALVSVAESKTRDLRLAGRFIEFQFDELVERAKVAEEHYTTPPGVTGFATHYEDDSRTGGGDAQMRYRVAVPELYTSTVRSLPVSRYLLEKTATQQQLESAKPPKFSEEFEAMTTTVLRLFNDVLRLQVDHSMKFKEAKIFACFEVFRNFLRQNALKEALKWLYRLYDAHKANHDFVEAGMVLVFIAALCYRVTELFYFVKGHDTKGARMPYGILTYVFWQDYVRILPEVDTLLSADTVYSIVSEMYVCPDDPCFTMEGQVQALKEAAELQDKGEYYEFSLVTIGVVDLYLRAQKDFKASHVVHSAAATWCQTISDKVKRSPSTYFLLWARMERAEHPKMREDAYDGGVGEGDTMVGERPRGLPNAKPIRRIHKMPPGCTVEDFKSYARSYIESLFPDPSLVELTDELTDTLPALPEPDTKRKRIAAVHRTPNRCWVTVTPVQPYFPDNKRVSLPDGYDKTLHVTHFRNVVHLLGNKGEAAAAAAADEARHTDLMSQRMSISTYEVDRPFPSTTSAIDVGKTHQVLLNPFDTTQETIDALRERINQAPENADLISVMREALSVDGRPPGSYMKEAIAVMSDHPEVIHSIRALSAVVNRKREVCHKFDAMTEHPEDYALVLKAVADMECSIIAVQTQDESFGRDE